VKVSKRRPKSTWEPQVCKYVTRKEGRPWEVTEEESCGKTDGGRGRRERPLLEY
jgi:hypothetical protein